MPAPVSLPCPGCHTTLRLRADLAGKNVQCPCCGRVVTIPEQAGGQSPGAREWGEPTYQPCPRCGAADPSRVTWTLWGSYFGPALLAHVRCEECGCGYNGRTGRSNRAGIALFVAVPLLLIAALVAAVVYLVLIPRGWL